MSTTLCNGIVVSMYQI